jgi:hypothetical protein
LLKSFLGNEVKCSRSINNPNKPEKRAMKVEAKKDGTNTVTAYLDGNSGNVVVGGNGEGGSLWLRDKNNATRVVVMSDPVEVFEDLSSFPNLYVEATKGVISLHGSEPTLTLYSEGNQPSIVLNAKLANMALGGPAAPAGDIFLSPANSNTTSIELHGQEGIIVLKKGGQNSIVLNAQLANMALGGPAGAGGNIWLYPENSTTASISLDGQSGDIVLSNADCAEDFDICTSEDVDPGTLMVIDRESKLRPSTEPYDKKVAGVVSGAGDCKPGIVLDRKRTKRARMPVALVGKVYCKADAEYSPIEVGDLLTTSSTPGYAMKANDPLKAFGAIIGKALGSLSSGRGLIPILVTLQ